MNAKHIRGRKTATTHYSTYFLEKGVSATYFLTKKNGYQWSGYSSNHSSPRLAKVAAKRKAKMAAGMLPS